MMTPDKMFAHRNRHARSCHHAASTHNGTYIGNTEYRYWNLNGVGKAALMMMQTNMHHFKDGRIIILIRVQIDELDFTVWALLATG